MFQITVHHAVACGFIFVLIILAALLAAQIWKYVWKWIDDAETTQPNMVVEFICNHIVKTKWKYPVYLDKKLWGYTKNPDLADADVIRADLKEGKDNDYIYTSKLPCSKVDRVMLFVFGAWVSPVTLFLSIKFYPVLLFIVTTILMAYSARFVRRLSKRFKLHEGNAEIHGGK